MWQKVQVGLCLCLFPSICAGQWVLTAIHPDPTPQMGAPEAEFIALTLTVISDTCVTSDGWSLEWNGSPRFCAAGCWPSGTTLVAHRAADSAGFDFGNAVSMPMATWPALVNGGGTVLLRDASGKVVDAMPYSAESLGEGGRPVMRTDTQHCGAAANQHLWEPGINPFCAPQSQLVQGHPTLLSAFAEAEVPERLVPRGAGQLDWFLGMTLNPVTLRTAEALVGGQPASVQGLSDSVVRLHWEDRPMGMGDWMEQGVPVSIGPVSGCFQGEDAGHLSAVYQPVSPTGAIAIVGALADPVSSDPAMPLESIAVLNQSQHPIGLGSWSFGGGFLRRQTVLQSDSVVWLNSSDFDSWPGMANDGGTMILKLPQGSVAAGLSWSPCDHDAPGLAGAGLPLVRSGGPGSAWQTAGEHATAIADPVTIKGYGCRGSQWTGQGRVELFLNRYLDQLGEVEWQVEGAQGPVMAEAVLGRPDGVSLWWEGMEEEVNASAGAVVSFQYDGQEAPRIKVQCPSAQLPGDAAPCLRVIELLWNASESGDEFAEVQNCGTVPIELSGLQATTEAIPLPSDWVTWVSEDASLVLAPGGVAAFGRCPKWMGTGLPGKGRSRWSADRWAPLNDNGGTLKIRLPGLAPDGVDEVQWGPHLKGPWWWTEDGWAWERTGTQVGDWSPAPSRGSPGAPPAQNPSVDCGDVAVRPPTFTGGLPSLEWAFPMAGGAIVVNMIDWPSGELLGRTVLEDVLSAGRWSWTGTLPSGRTSRPGIMLWELKWWTGLCQGRKRIVVDVPGHG